MLLELVLFCAFQILYGAMFQAVALLISAFMAGLAGGSWLVTSGPLSARPDRQLFVAVEGALLIFCGLLYLLFTLPALPMEGALRAHLLVLPLLIATGLLTGMQFPVASRLQQAFATRAVGVTTTGEVGTIFSADLIGGCLGGLLGGVVLLPVLGLAGSCLLAMSAKFGSLLLFSLSRKTARI
jgi:spermidine synthase